MQGAGLQIRRREVREPERPVDKVEILLARHIFGLFA